MVLKYFLGPLLFAAVTWGAIKAEIGDMKIQVGGNTSHLEDHETRISRIEGKLDEIIDSNKEILRRLK